MKILLLGSKGILGSTLKYYLLNKKINLNELNKFKSNKTKINDLNDFTYLKNKINIQKPDLIINCIVQKQKKGEKIKKINLI